MCIAVITGCATEDFLNAAPSVIAYIDRYAPMSVPEDYALAFIPYDWTVADQ